MDQANFRAKVLKRTPLFSTIASKILEGIPDIQTNTVFRSDSPILISHVYFLLNDAYKTNRRQITKTDDYKKAAISALAVMALRPFEQLDPDNVTSTEAYFANAIYAVACANAWISDRDLLRHYPFDYLRRFYMSLHRARFPSLMNFISAVNDGEDYSNICEIGLNWAEIDTIEDWIYKFWMMANQKR